MRFEPPRPVVVPGLLDNNQQDYATQLNKALQLQVKPPGNLDGTIQAGLILDDFTKPEFFPLRNGSRWQNLRVVTGVVGQRGWWQATGVTGIVTVIERVIISHRFGAPLDFNYSFAIAEAGGTGGGVVSRDDRGAFNKQAPSCAIVFGAAAAPTVPVGGYCVVPNDNNLELEVNQILTGQVNGASVGCFKIVCAVANAAFSVTSFHRERPQLGSERVP